MQPSSFGTPPITGLINLLPMTQQCPEAPFHFGQSVLVRYDAGRRASGELSTKTRTATVRPGIRHAGDDRDNHHLRGADRNPGCSGVVGAHGGFMPLWLFRNQTALTEPGPKDALMPQTCGQKYLTGSTCCTIFRTQCWRRCAMKLATPPPLRQPNRPWPQVVTVYVRITPALFIGCARLLGIPARFMPAAT